MGGIGSGRKHYLGARKTAEDCLSIDVRQWNKAKSLTISREFIWQWSLDAKEVASIRVNAGPDRITLSYQTRIYGLTQRHYYPVQLEWTHCHLGGRRPWFLCPAKGCGRRVAILYEGGIFACRHCHDLRYISQREHGYEKAARRAGWVRKKLGWAPGVLNGSEGKPKGMHRQTYYRLCGEYLNHVDCSLLGLRKNLKRRREKLLALCDK